MRSKDTVAVPFRVAITKCLAMSNEECCDERSLQ